MACVFVAVEDKLSEAVATRLILECTNHEPYTVLGKRGNGHLRQNLKNYCEIAKHYPLLLVTDLDRSACVVELIAEWKESVNVEFPENLLFRVAVTEIEAWLLADHDGMQRLLRARKLPHNADEVPNPKEEVLRLAEKASREVREDLVVSRGAIANQGLGYNARMCDFVLNMWCPGRASERSMSLRRCCERLRAL